MINDYLANFFITYIEKYIARELDTDSIINTFNNKKERRAQFKMSDFSRY